MNMITQFQKVISRPQAADSTQGARMGSAPSNPARLMPVCEALLGIFLILAIGAGWPGQTWGMVNVQPHPLWIVVLAIAVRYGAAYGYLAGGTSALTYLLLLWTRPDARFQLMESHDLVQPFLMFVVGAVVGELVEARERRVADLETKHREKESTLETLWQRHRTLEKVRRELEKQIAFQSNSAVILSAWGKRLQSLHAVELHSAIVELVSTVLEADACSLYLLSEGRLILTAASPESNAGRPESWQVLSRAGAGDSIIHRAICEGRVVTIRERLLHEGSLSIANEPNLMAGPLTLFNGQVYGMVVIESMPSIKITPASIDLFDVILGWASAALTNALLYEQAILKAEVVATIPYPQAICSLNVVCADVQLSE